MMKNISKLILLLLITLTVSLSAQTDTLITTNGEIITGEIKEMDRGVITIETDYSDSDFNIEWNKIHDIPSDGIFVKNVKGETHMNNNNIERVNLNYINIGQSEHEANGDGIQTYNTFSTFCNHNYPIDYE